MTIAGLSDWRADVRSAGKGFNEGMIALTLRYESKLMTEQTSSSHDTSGSAISNAEFEARRLLETDSPDVAAEGNDTLNRQNRLATIYAPIEQEMLRVESLLAEVFQHEHTFIHDLLQHGSLLGGKRIRPALLLLTAKACGLVREEHFVLATALEMIHTASLVHDDVLDEADTRRHVPTIHRRWNQESSILFGDYLFTQAFHLVGDRVGGNACGWIAKVTNRVCEGELRQIASRGQFNLGIEEYYRIIEAKTAALCQCATQLGAQFALDRDPTTADFSLTNSKCPNTEPDECIFALAEYGRLLGLAFQIADDVLDVAGREQLAGKSLGRDFELSKPTLPIILALRNAPRSQAERMGELLANQEATASQVCEWIVEHQGIDAARGIAQDHAEQAADLIRTHLPESPAYQTLIDLCSFVTDRSY